MRDIRKLGGLFIVLEGERGDPFQGIICTGRLYQIDEGQRIFGSNEKVPAASLQPWRDEARVRDGLRRVGRESMEGLELGNEVGRVGGCIKIRRW